MADVKEEGWVPPADEAVSEEITRTLGPPVEGLAPHEWLVLGRVFERRSRKEIAKEMRMTVQGVTQIINKPAFKRAVEMVEASIVERVARGEFGVMAIFKAEAVGFARRIVGISRASEDERIRFQANVKGLELAGIKPPAPAVTESPERLIDQMTAEEADLFAREGIFPERMADQLARLATSVIEKSEKARFEAHVDVLPPMEGENSRLDREPAREKPIEVVEED